MKYVYVQDLQLYARCFYWAVINSCQVLLVFSYCSGPFRHITKQNPWPWLHGTAQLPSQVFLQTECLGFLQKSVDTSQLWVKMGQKKRNLHMKT